MLLQTRCNAILEEIGLGPVRRHHGWEDSARLATGAVREIALVPQPQVDEVMLKLYPADTVSQAREFYGGTIAM